MTGDGPPLVLVHGSPSEHTTFDSLVEELRHRVTTFALDRRGSGASGDRPEAYAIEREFDDVAAVIDAVAARTGHPVTLFGHSYGANPAMGGATRTANLCGLVLYEPSFGLAYPPGAVDAIEKAVGAGDPGAAIWAALVGTGAATEEEFAAIRASPRWPRIVASAPTLPRECRVEERWTYQPGQFAAITAPTLMLTGSETPEAVAEATRRAAAAIPGATIRTLHGHGHFAHKADPALVAAIIVEFTGR
ncbi:MAG: alpha/beta fold hydrolase [Acidimicrobiales bacterium]